MAATSASSAPSAHNRSHPSAATTLRGLLDARKAERRALTLDEAVATIVPLCLDLQSRHARGELVHVHPSCIAPGPDGLARIADDLAGAPSQARDRACIAPELQSTLEAGNARASVFSVGAILYECVTGSAIGPAMRRPREINPSLPEALELLLAKALVGDPAHRPDDLGALASAMHHIAPMKSIHPPEVDQARLDHGADFEVDVRLSMLPPDESRPGGPVLRVPAQALNMDLSDPYGRVADRPSQPRPSGPNVVERLAGLKARLEADPRPRYVVNKERMDHGPFSAVELLQQIASNAFVADDVLRDELSGQSRLIKEWNEFAPFAEQAGFKRDVIAENKEVARVVRAEKKGTFAKSTIGVLLVLAMGAGAAFWFFQVRGSRKDDVEVDNDSTLDLNVDGGIKGAHRAGRRAAGGGAGGGGGGGGGGGMSYEAALAANPQQIDMNGHATGPDLNDGQLSGPMRNATFLSACGAPDSMHVTVKVAIKMGRAIGVSAYTNPPNGQISACIDGRIRQLAWPVNPKMDSFTTTY